MSHNRNAEDYSESKSSLEQNVIDTNLKNVILEKQIKCENLDDTVNGSINCYDPSKLIARTCNLTKETNMEASLVEKHLNNLPILLNQSDQSEEGRLVIAEFHKTDKNSSQDVEDNGDEFSDCGEKITTNIGNLSRDMDVQSPALENMLCGDSTLSNDLDEPLPIQAEVIMSEGSDDEKELEFPNSILPPKLKDKRSTKSKDTFCKYLVQDQKWMEKNNLNGWQLDALVLPQYSPTVDPPAWLKCIIPLKGYVCDACGDKFNIENSLLEHKERRSVLVIFDCNICNEKFIFHNRCTFKDHYNGHVLKGEYVNKEDAIIHPLPLDQMKLLQPIKINNYKGSNEKESPTCKLVVADVTSAVAKLDLEPKATTEDATQQNCQVECYMCNEKFDGAQQLIAHLKTDAPWSDEKVECKECHLILPSLCSAKGHTQIHSTTAGQSTMCPECGRRFTDRRQSVLHLNDCGHQLRQSGVVCPECDCCFFRFVDDFLAHWYAQHCSRYYQCFMCGEKLHSKCFHNCKYSDPRMPPNFNFILNCPQCPYKVCRRNADEVDLRTELQRHLREEHPTLVNRVHYVYKSKFCGNAFRTKAELHLHHATGHRRDGNVPGKSCCLADEVQTQLAKYFAGVQERNSFVMLSAAAILSLSQGASLRSPVLATLAPRPIAEDAPTTVTSINNATTLKKPESLSDEQLLPKNCYQCGYAYASAKEFRRHIKQCKQAAVVSLRCDTCRATVSKAEFTRHCLAHIKRGQGQFACVFCCGRAFASRGQLQSHLQMHAHRQFLYPVTCTFCGLVMVDATAATVHLFAKHQLDNVMSVGHQCKRCGRRFGGQKGLLIHATKCAVATDAQSSDTGGRTCNYCKRAVGGAEVFRKHMIGHLADGKLLCVLCDGWPFDTSLVLLHHLEDHARSLAFPHECAICPFTMTDAAGCLQHLKDEHGYSNVKCADCPMTYNYWFKLRRHVSIAHELCTFVKRRYICWICRSYDYVKKGSVLKHIRDCHHVAGDQIDEQLHLRTRAFGTLPVEVALHGKTYSRRVSPIRSSPPNSLDRPAQDQRTSGDIIKREPSDVPVTYTEQDLLLNRHNYLPVQSPRSVADLLNGSVSSRNSENDSVYHTRASTPTPLMLHGSPARAIKCEIGSDAEKSSPYKGIKIKFVFQNKDEKLVNRTKVVIQRMTKEYKPEIQPSPTPLVPAEVAKVAKVARPLKRRRPALTMRSAKRKKVASLQIQSLARRKPLPNVRKTTEAIKPLAQKKSIRVVKSLTKTKPAKEVKSLTQRKPAQVVKSSIIQKKSAMRAKPAAQNKPSSEVVKPQTQKPTGVGKSRRKKKPTHVPNDLKRTQAPDAAPGHNATNGTNHSLKLECKECPFSTNKKWKFQNHVASHEDKDGKSADGFHCEECGELFMVKPSLDRHLFFVHRIKKNHSNSAVKSVKPVEVCTKRSRSADGPEESVVQKSKRRLSEMVKSKEFHCNICKDYFPSSADLYTHLKSHGMAFLKMGQKRRSVLHDPV